MKSRKTKLTYDSDGDSGDQSFSGPSPAKKNRIYQKNHELKKESHKSFYTITSEEPWNNDVNRKNLSALPLKKRFKDMVEKENDKVICNSRTVLNIKMPNSEKVLKNVSINKCDGPAEDDEDSVMDTEDDSDIDDLFIELKKSGIKVDRTKKLHKSPKEISPNSSFRKAKTLSLQQNEKKSTLTLGTVPELEKSPDVFVLCHKRTPQKSKIEESLKSSILLENTCYNGDNNCRRSPRKKTPVKSTPSKKTEVNNESHFHSGKATAVTPVSTKLNQSEPLKKSRRKQCYSPSTMFADFGMSFEQIPHEVFQNTNSPLSSKTPRRKSLTSKKLEKQLTPKAKQLTPDEKASDKQKTKTSECKSGKKNKDKVQKSRASEGQPIKTPDSKSRKKVKCEDEGKTPESYSHRKSQRNKKPLTYFYEEDDNLITEWKSSRLKNRARSMTPENRSNYSENKIEEITPNTRSSKKEKRKNVEDTPERESLLLESSTKKKGDSFDIVTPKTRKSLQVTEATTPLQEARQRLHVSSVPHSLPCREKEFKNIYNFVKNKLLDEIGGCMYISGVPGTGKTATVHGVIKSLQKDPNIPQFKYIEVNGMRLSDPRQAYSMLYKEVFNKREKINPEQAYRKLDAWFSKNDSTKETTVLLVDELDLICTKKQEVVYNLLDWPTRTHSRLVVLTIANTMDMPERLLKGRVTSRLGLTRLTFLPYTHKQLEEIVLARLTGLDAFVPDAIGLVTRKVAAVSGDARRALDICRRATELPLPDEPVSISHIDQAVKEMTNSNMVKVIRGCSEMEKLFLRSMRDVSSRCGLEEVAFLSVLDQFLTLCTLEGFKKPPTSAIVTLSNRLKCSRLIFTNSSQAGILQRLTLNVTQDDIHYALKTP